ncbi:MAG: hypothetical protein AAF489_03555 [Bacteroidota bacterium]
MAKSRTKFNPGRILLYAEQILESAIISVEKIADKNLLNNRLHKSKNKKYKQSHQVIPDFDNERLERDSNVDVKERTQERLLELEELEQEASQDVELDRD